MTRVTGTKLVPARYLCCLGQIRSFAIDLAQGLEFCSEDRDIKVVLDICVRELSHNKTYGNKQVFFRKGVHYLNLKNIPSVGYGCCLGEVRRCCYRFCLTAGILSQGQSD